ncbi:MAG: redoxin domain-containing protein [Dehalococcoidia bacterium]
MSEQAVTVGQEAPDFTLRDENNQEVTLSALRGQPVMIAFYPFAFSGVCQGEMCEIRDAWPDFLATGAKVLAISRDSRFALKAWKDQQNFQHTLLADTKGDVAKKYGAWNEQVGAAERLSVVVGKDGKVTYVTRSENLGTPRDQKQALAALQAAAKA